MKRVLLAVVTCALLLYAPFAFAESEKNGQSAVRQQTQELQEQMLGNQRVMDLIMTLQHDPEMQSLLKDPAVLEAVSRGDVDALINNAAFMKLLDNPKVREIGRELR